MITATFSLADLVFAYSSSLLRKRAENVLMPVDIVICSMTA